jgi:hypothetical protein
VGQSTLWDTGGNHLSIHPKFLRRILGGLLVRGKNGADVRAGHEVFTGEAIKPVGKGGTHASFPSKLPCKRYFIFVHQKLLRGEAGCFVWLRGG